MQLAVISLESFKCSLLDVRVTSFLFCSVCFTVPDRFVLSVFMFIYFIGSSIIAKALDKTVLYILCSSTHV